MKIKGMMCPHCEARVRDALLAVEGVKSAVVSHERGEALVETASCADALVSAVTAAGYEVLSVE